MSFNPFDEFPLIPGTEALQHPLQLPEGDLGEKTRRKPRFLYGRSVIIVRQKNICFPQINNIEIKMS